MKYLSIIPICKRKKKVPRVEMRPGTTILHVHVEESERFVELASFIDAHAGFIVISMCRHRHINYGAMLIYVPQFNLYDAIGKQEILEKLKNIISDFYER